MCGIAGKIHFERHRPSDPALLLRMMDVIQHRGPDAQGVHLSGPVALGHVRLSIIDIATGIQPMSNEDGSIWVVYNGEIYNFRDLRRNLESRGHRFKSSSDTEVIVHLYEEYGDECVSQLQGMFAFALWDEARQRLLLARDPIGIKPLYYSTTQDALAFASEIKALLVDPAVSRDFDPAVVDTFMTYHYVPGPHTPFKGIRKLEPGHYMTVENGRVSVHEYWDLKFSKADGSLSFEDAAETLRHLLRSAVRDHLMSDVPLGVLLSGGVDSTAVLHYASEFADRKLHTFTVGFEGENFADERPFARLAARKYETVHQEITVGADEFRDFLPRYIWHMEEPVCEPPAVALFFVSQLARRSGVKVLLSGEGGDEAFGGYPEYANVLMLEALKSAVDRVGLLPSLGFAVWAAGRLGWKMARRHTSMVRSPPDEYYLSRTGARDSPFGRARSALYSPAFLQELGNHFDHPITQTLMNRVKDHRLLNRMLYVDSKSWLPDDLLIKADKMTMATSVELRVPLLDLRIMDFAAQLPPSYKVSGRALKRVLKAALKGVVPQEIIDRKKTGFPVPYESWLRRDLSGFVHDIVLSPTSFSSTYFDKRAVQKLLSTQQRTGEGSKEIFSLLVLDLWHQQFSQPPSSIAPVPAAPRVRRATTHTDSMA